MTDIKNFNIDAELSKKHIPITKQIYIPRYTNNDDGTTVTLQNRGWHPSVESGHNQLVHYCEKCKQQRTFTITGIEKKTSKAGREYTHGYWAYCNFCQENQ